MRGLDLDTVSYTSAIFEAMGHPYRRAVLELLRTRDGPMTLHDLATAISVREHDADITDVPRQAVPRTFLALHHLHLPKLANYGLIAYDTERKLVSPAELPQTDTDE